MSKAVVAMIVAASSTLLPASAAAETSAPAEALYRQGVAAFEAGRFSRSLRLLRRARRGATSPRLVGSIELYRGINHAVMGNPARARASFAAAMRHDATLALDRHRHKPAIVRLFDQVRAEMRGYLEVVAPAADGARVSIDGEPAGAPPLRSALGIGRHRIEIRDGAGKLLLAREVIVAPERTTRLAVEPPRRSPPARAERGGEAEATLERQRRRRPRARRRIWTWVAAGGAVVAGAIGVGVGAAALSNHDEYLQTQDPQRFDELSERIPTQVAVANTMYVVGGLLAAGAVALYFIEGRSAAPRARRRPFGALERLPVSAAVDGRGGWSLTLKRSF